MCKIAIDYFSHFTNKKTPDQLKYTLSLKIFRVVDINNFKLPTSKGKLYIGEQRVKASYIQKSAESERMDKRYTMSNESSESW